MSYLFSADNWEWLWSSNNARFVLEAFLDKLRTTLKAAVSENKRVQIR